MMDIDEQHVPVPEPHPQPEPQPHPQPEPMPEQQQPDIDPVAKLQKDFEALRNKQAAGRAVCWQHLDPVLLEDPATGQPTAVKLRCQHCGSLFSSLNPSRTVTDHLKACKKYDGELPVGRAQKPPPTPTPQPPQLHLQPHPISALPSVTLGVGVPSPVQFQPRPAPSGATAASYAPSPTTRQQPLELGRVALLFIDIQNYNCNPQGALGQHLQGNHYYWGAIARATPLWQELAATARQAGFEVMYTVIQSLTRNGRDRGLDYQISGFHVPPASWDALVLDSIRPGDDEVVLPKSSSSVFTSTTLHYILRNMGISQLVVAGALTDQCVDHAIRDAADLGYWVTQVTDACVTSSEERHMGSIHAVSGYCRQRTTGELLQEIRSLRQRRGA